MTHASEIGQELCRVSTKLRQSYDRPEQYMCLYAVQQALSWAENPELFMPPCEAIMGGKVWAPIPDTPEGSEDCSEIRRPVQS